jgi:predicted TIM-barrel fold metal-dependent hydrolase
VNSIPIFDCVTHPSLDGDWIHPRWAAKNSFSQLGQEMSESNVQWSFAIAMDSTGRYELTEYPQKCASQPFRLFPVAFFPISECGSEQQVEERITLIRELGYRGIKIHPRLSGIDFEHPLMPTVIQSANRCGLVVLLCTYFYSSDPGCRRCSPETLRELLHRVSDEKLILVHGGGVRLLEVSEMTRSFKNVLLDLSFTLCEYAGSSVDLDLKYVFQRCQRRVCLGSDSPEISLARMRERFEYLTQGLERAVREQIAYQNLFAFTGLSP